MRRPAFFIPRRIAPVVCLLGLLAASCSSPSSFPSLSGSETNSQPVVAQPAPVPKPVPPPVQAQAKPQISPPPAPVIPNRSGTAALLLPLSGPAAATGLALFNAAQLALFEVGDDTFTLLPVDTKGTADGAVTAMQQAIEQHAEIIIGPLFSAEAKAVGPIARQAGIPVIAFTTDRNAIGDGVWSLGFLPGPQAVQVAIYAQMQKRTRLAVLAPSSEYGRRVVDFLNADSSVGPTITALEYYDPASNDLTGPIHRLVHADPRNPNDPGFDALLLPEEGSKLKAIASMLSLQGIDPKQVKLLGTQLWEDSKPSSEPALAGGWYAAPPATSHAEFDARYARSFNVRPVRLASLGYDAGALVAVLARRSPHKFLPNVLTNSQGFAGVDGLFRLLPDGTSERGYAIWEVSADGNAKQIAPAPASFQAAY